MLSAALVALVLLAAWFVVKSQIHDEIRQCVEQRLAQHYAGLRVSVRSARLIEGRGIEIYGVLITEKDGQAVLANVDEIFAACPITTEQLLSGERPQARHLAIRGLKAWAKQRPDGSWNVDQLWPLPKFGPNSPPSTIKDGVVKIAVGDSGKWSTFSFRDVDLQVTPERPTVQPGQLAAGTYRPPVRIRGTLKGDFFDTVNLQARIDPNTGAWEADGAAEGLQLSPQLHAALPASWRKGLESAASVSGRMKLSFHLAQNGSEEDPVNFAVSGTLSEGQIADRRLPVRLYDVEAQFYWDNDRVMIESLSARNGATTLELSLEQNGTAKGKRFALAAHAKKLVVDDRFLQALPNEPFKLQSLSSKYSPDGVVDADLSLEFKGGRWITDVYVKCLDVSFKYYKFPYRLERGNGTVTLKDDVVTIDMEALASGQTVNIHGVLNHPNTNPTGWVEVACEQPIPLNDELLAALDDRTEKLVRSFHPSGSLTVVGRFERDGPGAAGVHRDVKIGLHNCSIQYEKFPYPLSMIRGTMRWNDEGWIFQDLSGRNDSGYIECEGTWKRTSSDDGLLALDFVGVDVPLEDELRDALSPSTAQLWSEVRPRGSIDHLMINLRYPETTKLLSLDIRTQQWRKKPNDEGRSMTIFPTWFPYRLDDLEGVAVYKDGIVTLESVSALHDDTLISLNGRCAFGKEGYWQVQLTDVVADRVSFDHELLEALPAELGKAAGKLNLRGSINVLGWLSFSGGAGANEPPTANWDVTFDIENGSMRCGLELDHIHGDVRLYGSSGRQGFYSRGKLDVDSMFFRDVQLTQVSGPLLITPIEVVLGAESERDRTDGAPRQLTANIFGGQLSADARVQLDSETPYLLQARLVQGDLGQLAQEMAMKNRDVHGKVNALLNLSGNGYGRHSWRGNGGVWLYDADIYKIPVMVALLKPLLLSRPDRTAFESGEIQFRIEGEQGYLDKINFHGDAVSLKGSGEVNLDRQIDLEFYTLVGQREFDLAALRALLQQASAQIFRIRVRGTLDRPDPTRLPLPVVQDTLQQLFPDAAKRREKRRELDLRLLQPLETARRRLMPGLGRQRE